MADFPALTAVNEIYVECASQSRLSTMQASNRKKCNFGILNEQVLSFLIQIDSGGVTTVGKALIRQQTKEKVNIPAISNNP